MRILIYRLRRKIYNKVKNIFKRRYTRPFITETGSWQGENNHFFDRGLANEINRYLRSKFRKGGLIGDFGCGSEALYCKYFKKKGWKVFGLDGNNDVLNKSAGLGKVQDLTENFYGQQLCDAIICLEVGEHVPRQYEEVLIQNLHTNSKGTIILSWAIRGQGGHGHVNEKDNIEVIRQFENIGYRYNIFESEKMRRRAKLSHFKETVMVFERG